MTKRFLFIFIFLLPFALFSQSELALEYDGVPLSEVLKDLESKYNVVFSYTANESTNRLVQYNGKSTSISDHLTRIFEGSDLTFEIVSKDYIVISPVEKKPMELCGRFTNESGEALSFVNVFISDLGIGTNGDESGNLNWSVALQGNEKVELSYIGYETMIVSSEFLLDCPQLVLKTESFSFEEVIVKEYVTSGIEQSKDLDHMVMRPDKINAVPGLTDADVLQMVQLLPGVQSVDESATGLYIRGGTPDQNLILYDGVPVYNSGHFFGMISGFNPSLVETVDVYRSGFGAEYGGRVSGVIDIESTSRVPSQFKVDAGINFTHGDVSVSTPVFKDKIGLVLGVRKSYTDIVETPTYKKLSSRVFRRGKLDDLMNVEEEEEEEEEEIDFNLVFDFVDYNAKLILKPSARDDVALSFFRMEDQLNFDYSEGIDDFVTNDKLNQDSNGLGFSWKRAWNTKFRSSLNLSHTQMDNNYEFSIQDGDELGSELEDIQSNFIEDNTLVWSNTWDVTKRFNLEFGAQYTDLLVRSQWQVEPTSEDIVINENEIATGFLTIGNSMADKLKTSIGLRYNYGIGTANSSFEPRLDLQYFPADNLQIKANAGMYRQFINQVIEFNDLGINQDFWVLAEEDEETDVARSTNLSMGIIFHPKSFLFEVEGYYRNQDGLASNLSRFQIDQVSEFDLGTGRSWGVDVLLKKRWNKWQSWIAYSYGRTKYELELEDQIINFNAPHDRPHSFRFVQQWNSEKWNISLNWTISSGLAFTEAQGLEVDGEEQIIQYDLEDINNARLPITHRLDASIVYNFLKTESYTGKIGCSFLNIYDKENLMSREYFTVFDDDADEYELQARDRTMLRFTPNIVVRIAFH